MGTILTLDLGTTYFKLCLFDESGALLDERRVTPPVTGVEQGRWELKVERFEEAVADGIRGLLAQQPPARPPVEAISFATQTNSFVLVDEQDRFLTPIILWPDTRAVGMPGLKERLDALVSLQETTGVVASLPELMVAKLWWFQRNEPRIWTRVRRVNLISDYFTHWLTGVRATEAGAQGLTGLCDIRTLEWVKRACAEFGVEQDWLPPIVRAGTDLGRVRTQRARELGLSENCRLVVGCLDQYAGAIGVGNVHPGGCSETTGTVLAVVQCSESPVRGGDGVFQGPGWAGDRFYRMRFGSVSANLLEWYRNQLPDRPSFAALDGLAAAVPPGAGGVRVTVNETGGGMITGFTGGDRLSDPGHCVRAILERVAVALEEHVGALCGAARPSGIRCAGGGARSRLWLQIKADLVGIPMTATACTEPTSLGAAMLGATALGWGTLPQLAARWVHPVLTCVPDPQRHESYRRLYGIGG